MNKLLFLYLGNFTNQFCKKIRLSLAIKRDKTKQLQKTKSIKTKQFQKTKTMDII
jgi:hypothetical protein